MRRPKNPNPGCTAFGGISLATTNLPLRPVFLTASIALGSVSAVVARGGFFLQLYAAPEPVRIGQFHKHHPPERLSVWDGYPTFCFSFLPGPVLLVKALLALSLYRWLDTLDGLR